MSRLYKLDKLEKNALDFLQNRYDEYGDSLFVGTSGGKDSAVILDLMRRINPHVLVVHNTKGINDGSLTSMDVRTLKHLYSYVCSISPVIFCKSSNMEFMMQKYDLRMQVDGSREDESTRDGKSTSVVVDGKLVSRANIPWVAEGLFGLKVAYPIKEWTSNDVFDYHKKYSIPLSDEYLDDPEYQLWRALNV